MTEEQENIPAVPPPQAAPAAAASGTPRWLPAGLIVLLAAVGVLGWQTLELRGRVGDARIELAQRLAQGEGALGELRAALRQAQDSLAAQQARTGVLEAKIAQTESQAAALEALYQEFSRARDDRLLAEIEQLLGLASQQLQVAGNLEAALIALQGAEQRLALADQPQFMPLRAAIARDQEILKNAPQLDIAGLSHKLEVLLERIDTLPLAFSSLPAETSPAQAALAGDDWRAFLLELGRDLWNELRQLVRIERLDQPVPVLLAPEQSSYLRENVKIRLLTARLALLARDGRSYGEDLRQAAQWLERYFDPRDELVQRSLAELRALAATPVNIARPSLNESLTALRALQARMALTPAIQPPAPPAH